MEEKGSGVLYSRAIIYCEPVEPELEIFPVWKEGGKSHE